MPLIPQAEALIDAFSREAGVTAEHSLNLRHAIASSPLLTDEFNALVAQGNLRSIIPLNHLRARSFYVPAERKLRLPLEMLQMPPDGGSFSDTAVFVLGCEMRHALDAFDLEQWQDHFDQELVAVANAPCTEHDYTLAIDNHLAVLREHAAVAEISGWNALICAAQHESDGTPSLENLRRRCLHMRNFIDVDPDRDPPIYSLKPGLTTGIQALHMPAFPGNIEVVGRHCFDDGMRHAHAAEAIGRAVRCERYYSGQRPEPRLHVMSIDMARLRLDGRGVAQYGIDLGDNTLPMPYLDKSHWPPIYAEFRHTAPGGADQLAPPSLDQACHPDHALYRQARAAVHKLDARIGRAPDRRSDNLAAALAVSARRDGLDGIDHIVQDAAAKRTDGHQYHRCTSLMRVTSVDTARSTYTTVEESSRQWRQVMQQRESRRPNLEQHRQRLPR